jgi:hypothetical protein
VLRTSSLALSDCCSSKICAGFSLELFMFLKL